MAPPPPGDSQRTWSQWSTSAQGVDSPPLAERYRLLDQLGEGGGGEVYRAVDLLSDREVAVKRFRVRGDSGRARIRREVAALRLLDLPGVVRILDDGTAEGDPFVVMELVPGAPFPGADVERTWEQLRKPTLSLLETLGRIHDAGVVHRDIKPGNVLVDEDGNAVLLDFGLARGQPVGSTVTSQGLVLGTPRYLAPEQLIGDLAGPAADLYAVGVMLYEALAGLPPHDHEDMEALWRAKLMTPPVPLQRLAPRVPRQVADVVQRLLQRKPEERLPSAAAVLTALGADARSQQLPWLGPRAVPDAIVAAGRAGTPIAVAGPAGSGRSRALQEGAEALQADGIDCDWTVRGTTPFESVVPIVGALDALAGDDLPMPQAVQAALQARLDSGRVLLVDDPDALDRWTRALLAELRGAVIIAGTPESLPPDLPLHRLAGLRERDLRSLFAGPDRLLHIRQDAAHELHRRTRGRPDQIDAELRAWIRAGLARWQDRHVVVDRQALDRLRGGTRTRTTSSAQSAATLDPDLRDLLTWVQLAGDHAAPALLARLGRRPAWQVELELEELVRQGALVRDPQGRLVVTTDADLASSWPAGMRRDAHAALAAQLPLGADHRLFHLLAGGRTDDLATEAVSLARRLRSAGKVGEAEAALVESLRAVRREDADGEDEILAALVRTAVAAGTGGALERARYEVRRAASPDARLLAVLDAAIDAQDGHVGKALAALDDMPPFDRTELELARLATRLLASRWAHTDTQRRVLADVRDWSARTGDAEIAARLPGWEGILAYREGRFEDAARLHEESAAARTEPLGRTSALTNAAMAWLEACEFERALHTAERARQAAEEARAPMYEARAVWIPRSVAVRRDEGLAPDLELVRAVVQLGHQELAGTVALTEAMLAWKAGDPTTCCDLARQALEQFEHAGIGPACLHARAIVTCTDSRPPTSASIDALAQQAAACPLPVVGLDVLGILADAGDLSPTALEAAERLACALPSGTLDVARGMMSPGEALRRVRRATSPGEPALPAPSLTRSMP
ncbi:MAG: protein kinase [Alphaproteobacteria bacterium]|nr:protein kinase [Alphaproteobacteria bacterium]